MEEFANYNLAKSSRESNQAFPKGIFFLIFKTNVELLCCFQIYSVKVVKVA